MTQCCMQIPQLIILLKGLFSPFFLLSWAYLHSQTQRVEHNEEEHEVLEVAGGDNVPHPVLVGVLGDVASQRPSLQRVLDALALHKIQREVTMSE